MKLCGLTQSYAPTGGGIRTFLDAQRFWCRDHGVQHTLIVPGPVDSVHREDALTLHTIASPHVPGSNVYRLLLRSDKVLRILRAELPDVTEVHCAYNLPWTALLHRRRRGGMVSGFFMTDVPIAYVEAMLAPRTGARLARAARRLAERYLRALYNRCDVAITISPSMHERLLTIGVRDPLHVPLGVDLETFSPDRFDRPLRLRFGVGDEDLLLVYAGRLDIEKRPTFVLDAFEQLPASLRAHLIIAGDGPLRTDLEERAACNARMHVLPFITDRIELARHLASADIYVSGMAHETFGLSVVEAQACGLPVVGVRAGAMVDRVQSGEGFLVAVDSPQEMAERIVSTPRDDWRRMGRRARERVQAEFSWNRTFETLLQIYQTRR